MGVQKTQVVQGAITAFETRRWRDDRSGATASVSNDVSVVVTVPRAPQSFSPVMRRYHSGWWNLAQARVTVPRVMARIVPLVQMAA